MGAFRGALKVKANAIETDIHMTKDDVLVLSHVSYIYGQPSTISDKRL